MKKYYLVTKDATKYWKKAIKNDRVMVANDGESIYIVNGFNAFKLPAMPAIWDDLARQAFMENMPEPGAAFQYMSGERQTATADDVKNIFNRQLSDKTIATRSAFTVDSGTGTLRLYKNENGSITGINSIYDAMIDHDLVMDVYCGGRYSPVIFVNADFAALVMPCRMQDNFKNRVRETFDGLLEA